MCFQRDCLSHETVETSEYDEYSAGWSQASALLTLKQVPENVTEISINLLVEGTNRKRRKKDVTVACDKGTNRNI